ncbi:MAG TPA: MotA/TolQ/ExbB proton channel family protein [Polyangia bacterium]|nr:MotA/TolQ/ExbB proton channel family protein [Polyangia bacterium]
MHVILGIGILIASLYSGHHLASAKFGGLFHLGSLIILAFAPVGVACIAYNLRTLAATAVMVGRALFGGRRAGGPEARARLLGDLYAFGRAVRGGRAAEAGEILARADEPLLRDAGPLVLARTPGSEVAETVQTLAYAQIAHVRAAEDVLKTLSKAAPSFGMVGTIMGLVDVLTNLKDFDKLGPGMALAIMTTLYGLVLAQGVYVPLAAAVGEMGQRIAVAGELLARGLGAIADGRSIYELRVLAGQGGATDELAPRPEERAA